MSQRKLLNDKQLGSLKQMGFTKKELKSLATIKCKNFFVGQLDTGMRTGELLGHAKVKTTMPYAKRLNEDGTIKNG